MVDNSPGDVVPVGVEQEARIYQYLTWRVGERHYALPGEEVAEIVPVPASTRLPHSPKGLLGLINLRGTVLPLVDPRALLGYGSFTRGDAARAIVCFAPDASLVALAVDAVVSIEGGRIAPRQADLAAEAGERLRGAFPSAEGRVIKVLDLPAMLAVAFGERGAPARQPPSAAAPAIANQTAKPTETQQLLVSFSVAGQDYALGLEAVHEIVPLPEAMTVVPRAEEVLLGVTAYRDGLLPLLSLRVLLGFAPPETRDGGEKVIVIPVGGALVGLVADRMRAIIRANAGEIETAPSMLAARAGGELRIASIWRGNGGGHLVSVLATEQLFREDVMRRLRDAKVAAPLTSAATATFPGEQLLQFVAFQLGDETFALPISAVDEVAAMPDQITRVPKTPKFLEGVINLRGTVLPVVDQRRRFDLPKIDGGHLRRLIVVRTERHRAGLIVDTVSGIVRSPADAIEPAPELGQQWGETGARLISGIINDTAGHRMILLLDPTELLTGAERAALDTLDLAEASEPAGQSAR